MPLIAPHQIKSRKCTEADIDRIKKDAREMISLCHQKHGMYPGGEAVAHSQITNEDPLRFFVTKAGDIIINPRIINHGEAVANSPEGCLSMTHMPPRLMKRWKKCTVRFQVIDGSKFKDVEEEVSGHLANIFQHEIQHFFGKYVY